MSRDNEGMVKGDMDMPELSSDFINRERGYSKIYGGEREIRVGDLVEEERLALENSVECVYCRTIIPNSLWHQHDCQNSGEQSGE